VPTPRLATTRPSWVRRSGSLTYPSNWEDSCGVSPVNQAVWAAGQGKAAGEQAATTETGEALPWPIGNVGVRKPIHTIPAKRLAALDMALLHLMLCTLGANQ
jgi:hypothetical protein